MTVFFNYFSVPCQGAVAAEVEAGAAAEREEGEEGNTCWQCLTHELRVVQYTRTITVRELKLRSVTVRKEVCTVRNTFPTVTFF